MIDTLPILATGAEIAAFAWAVAVNLAVAYAAYWVASQFASPSKQKMPEASNYPIQTSMKGIPIPKVYGTCRIAGNVIWMGQTHPFVVEHDVGGGKGGGGGEATAEETRYRKSFLLALCEGPASVIRAWKGKDEIELSEFTIFEGIENTGIRVLTGEDYGDYPDLCCVFFDEYDLGNTEALPNFTFEISSSTGFNYKYTYISENGAIWGVPLTDGSIVFISAGPAVNVGGGIVGITYNNASEGGVLRFVSGDVVTISGTTNYNGNHTLTAGTTITQFQFADTYIAETFDGTETVVKVIAALSAGYGRMIQDADGNLYYAHNWANNTLVTKILPDGTFVYDFLTTTWPTLPGDGGGAISAVGLGLSADNFLYIEIDRSPGFAHQLEKYNLTTGLLVWSVDADDATGATLALDANGNCYSTGGTMSKFAAADGTKTDYTLTSTMLNHYAITVDDDLGIVIKGGADFAAGSPANLYNLEVRTLDDTAGDVMAVGGTHWNDPLWATYIIGVGQILIHDGFIYVMLLDIPTQMLYKIQWDGSNLSLVNSVEGPPYAVGFYFDLWGNLVVINQDWIAGQDDVFWFYDEDLNYLGKVEGIGTSVLRTWDSITGSATIQGNLVFQGKYGAGGITLDVNPADIIQDLIEHPRYGMGRTDICDPVSFASCWQYWQDHDMLLSLVINEAKPWKDWVDYILSHCRGYRFTSGGTLHLGVLQSEAAVATLTDDDLVQSDAEAENLPPKVQIIPRPASDTYNRIEVAWTDRDNRYDLAIAIAQDRVDQVRSGSVRKKTVKLVGIMNQQQAVTMAWYMLIDALYRFNLYKFTLSYKRLLVLQGDVVSLSDNHLLSGEKVRILNIEEAENGRDRACVAMDDLSEHYPTIPYITQQTLHVPDAPVTLVDDAVAFREDIDALKLYLSIAPGGAQTNGWYIYRSYDDVTYELAGRCGIGGITGGDANSAGTLESSLPAHGSMTWAPDETALVDIGTVTDLHTDITDDQFWGDSRLAQIGDEIISFRDAVETGTPGVWQISHLRRGLFGTEAAAHSATETFVTLDKDFTWSFAQSDIGRTVYFKALTFYGRAIQNIADVSSFSVTIEGYAIRPAAASLLRLTADENDGGSGEYAGSSFTLYWNLGSRISGWNWGGWDVSGGGVPWNNYIADAELQAIVLKFEQAGGTPIGQREIAVGESATVVKATDLGGFDTARIRVVPRRVLESRLQNDILVTSI